MASTVTELLRRRFGGKKKEYVDVYKTTFPANATLNNSYYMFIYSKETLPSGTNIHLSFALSNIPSTLTYIHVSQSNSDTAALRVASFSPPFDNLNVEFTTNRNVTFFGLFFSENVNLQVTSIVLEKII